MTLGTLFIIGGHQSHGHVINLITIKLPDMIMEEIMNSKDQDHLMQQVKIVDTKIQGNLMIKEATVKKGKKNLPNPYTYVNIFV